jgi:hypothetical protein
LLASVTLSKLITLPVFRHIDVIGTMLLGINLLFIACIKFSLGVTHSKLLRLLLPPLPSIWLTNSFLGLVLYFLKVRHNNLCTPLVFPYIDIVLYPPLIFLTLFFGGLVVRVFSFRPANWESERY